MRLGVGTFNDLLLQNLGSWSLSVFWLWEVGMRQLLATYREDETCTGSSGPPHSAPGYLFLAQMIRQDYQLT